MQHYAGVGREKGGVLPMSATAAVLLLLLAHPTSLVELTRDHMLPARLLQSADAWDWLSGVHVGLEP